MKTDLSPREKQYFWSGWLESHSLMLLITTFSLLSLADLLATIRLLYAEIITEGNALAEYMWLLYRPWGFIIYKVALVAFIIMSILLVYQRNARLARIVLYGAILLMGAVTLRHIAIFCVVASMPVMRVH